MKLQRTVLFRESVYALFSIFLATTFWVVAGFARGRYHELRIAQNRAGYRAKIAGWDKLTFTSVLHSDIRHRVRSAFMNQESVGDNKVALDSLLQTVETFFEYESNPTFQKFLSCRTNGIGVRFEPPYALRKLLHSSNSAEGSWSTEPVKAMATAWQFLRDSGRAGGAERLDSVALDSIRIVVKSAESPPDSVLAEARKEFTSVGRSFNSGCVYSDNPAQARDQKERRLYAQLHYVGKLGPSQKTSPFYVLWFWSEQDRQWRPASMLFDMQCRYVAMF
jgi:hypothetical protein